MKFLKALLRRFTPKKAKAEVTEEPVQSKEAEASARQPKKTARAGEGKKGGTLLPLTVFCAVLLGAGALAFLFFPETPLVKTAMSLLNIEPKPEVVPTPKAFPVLTEADRALFKAIRAADAEGVRRWLKAGAHVNAEEDGIVPIKAAIALNRTEIIGSLIEAGCDISSVTGGNSPLIYAIVQNKPEIIRELLKTAPKIRADVDAIDKNGHTPLYYAINRNCVEAARSLLAGGANVNAPDREGRTPLMLAAANGKADMISALLRAGADTSIRSPAGETAINIARQRNRQVVISLLAEAESSPN
jgi:hypothetical protein